MQVFITTMHTYTHTLLIYAACITTVCMQRVQAASISHTVATSNHAPLYVEVKISGQVRDRLGKPIPGATIRVAGTNRGTTTNEHGHFEIVVDEKGSLEVSFIGYKTQTVAVNNTLALEIVLEAAEGNMNEVVVVGFGQQRKISLIGAQSTVKVSDLKQPVGNLSTVLAGRLAGVVAVQRTGEPGHDDADIWIRGISTFTNNNTRPLILVDGVERSISNLEIQDLESFTILKDASATAVYGVRGANGVVIVKTKSGLAGKTRISFDYNQGITTFTRYPEMADGITYMQLANEALTTRGQQPKYTQAYIDNTASGKDPLVYPNVNWFKEVFNKWGHNRRANLNIRGGNPNASYYLSLSYYDEKGFFRTDKSLEEQYNADIKYKRYNFTSNLNLKATKTTTLELGIQGYISNGNYPGVSSTEIFQQALQVPPVEYALMYPGGFVPGRNPNGGQRNPYADVNTRGYQTEFKNQGYTNLRGTQDLGFWVKGLSFTSMFAFDVYNTNTVARTKREDTWIVDANQPYKDDGSLNLLRTYTGSNYLSYNPGRNGNRRFYTETSLNYDNEFGKHRVGGLLLYNQSDYVEPFAGDFTSSIPYRNRGLALRATYSWRDRYFAEFNAGYNGSENFAPNKRYGFFPAYGVGWVLSNEPFFKPLQNAVQLLKFRFSDGWVGSGSGGRRFGYLTLVTDGAAGYTFGQNRNVSLSGINVSDYAADVTWSTSHKTDLGMDIRILHDALSLTVDLFKEHRTGVFLQRAGVPGFVGLVNEPWGNLGIVDNKGIDLTLEYSQRIGEVQARLYGNFTYNKDKVIENDAPEPKFAWQERRGTNMLSRFGYVAEGLFVSDEEIAKSALPGSGNVKPGDIKYKDVNGDGIIDSYDQVRIGRGDVPAVVYGFGLNLSWKGISLGAFFQGQAQADIMLSGGGIMPFNGDGGVTNVYSIATDRWTPENPNPRAFYPRLAFGQGDNYNNTLPSTWWVKDASFLRMKSAELSYELPRPWLKRTGVASSRVYFTGFNLITFSKFKLWDVELLTSDGARYPNVTTYSMGINLQF